MYSRKEIEKKILASLSETRADNERIAQQNLNNARKNSEFNNVFTQIKDLEFLIAEKSFKNEDDSDLKTKLTKLRTKYKTIIKKLGLNEKDFEPKYECEKCKDTGYIEAKQCTCFRLKVNTELIKACGLEETKLNTFENFDSNVSNDQEHKILLEKLKSQLIAYSTKFPNTRICNIIISGPTGVGKTFALECTTSEVLKRGFTANFITSFQLNNQFLKYHGCYDANKQSYLNILLEPDLLVIDDLGTEPMFNNVTKEYLYLIISERMLKHKGTLISTNLTPAHIIDRYGERVFSRLFDKSKSILIGLNGNDLRRLKRS